MRAVDRTILKVLCKRLIKSKRDRFRNGIYPLQNLFFFVTMRCNAKCEHCFCWQDLNVGIPEPSLEDIDKLAASTPPFNILILTGGEPMIRKDILEVCTTFARHGLVGEIKLNTNALFPDRIANLAEQFKKEFPDVGLSFQVSLDGLEETHDKIRGVPGNFRKAIESLKRVTELRKHFPNLYTDVLTVVNALNWQQLVPLNAYLQSHVSPDLNHGFELVRDVERTAWNINPAVKEKNVGPKNMDLPPVEAFPQIAAAYKTILDRAPFRVSPYYLHNLAQLEMVRTGKPAFKCVTAGQSVGVIYSNGDLTACEFTTPFTNMAQHDWNFTKAWNSEAAWQRRTQIRGCHCIHGSFHGKAVEYSWRGIAAMAKEAL